MSTKLRVRAARAGRSMEAEARAILTAAVQSESVSAESAVFVQDWVARLYGGRTPEGVVDRLLADRKDEASDD